MTMVTGNDHWSIGEVLSLLQDEFPEITISKIRFLESQDLISPERTPSGYRRFYRGDFDRLQWILVQQRDHYLPLKVIRDRIESDESVPGTSGVTAVQAPTQRAADIAAGEVPRSNDDGSVGTTAKSDDNDRHQPLAATEPEVEAENEGPEIELVAESGSSADAGGEQDLEFVNPPITERRGKASSAQDYDSNVALTKEELAEASGCSVETIEDLERFALVSGREIGPTVLYDGEALLVSRLAAQFGSFGLDPRHLRTFRIGAEREVELLIQVVEPMMHRRDPEMRRRSLETLDDLVELSASLRAVLMRQRVRSQLPNQRG